ncbi:LexA family protein [Microbulbifer sp. TRSA005]|uniref:LexA family protein n=1 Tax=unclassified Microbulbifer TaxID=2619833 RepID=UPI004039ABE5
MRNVGQVGIAQASLLWQSAKAIKTSFAVGVLVLRLMAHAAASKLTTHLLYKFPCSAVDLLEPGEAEASLPCPGTHSGRSYALRVNGDSMTSLYPGQRSYPEGTIIFVDPDKPLTNGCRVIAKINGEVIFKSYAEDMGHIYLRPINPTYSPMEVTGKIISFCGVIIGSYTPK